jgi:hypothetical protein
MAVVPATGLLMGLAVGAPLWLTFPAPQHLIQHCAREASTASLGGASLPLDCPAAYAFSRPTVVPPLLIAGGLFGAMAQRRARRGSPGAVTLIGAGGLLLVTFGGAQLVTRRRRSSTRSASPAIARPPGRAAVQDWCHRA